MNTSQQTFSVTQICERQNSKQKTVFSYQSNRSSEFQVTAARRDSSISVYNTSSMMLRRPDSQSHTIRWTKSGEFIPPRFNVHYDKLGQLAVLPKNWDGCDSPRPSPVCVRHAKQALEILSSLDFHPNGVVPGGEGGIGITFRRPGRYADIEFFNDGEAMSAFHVRDGQSEPIIEDVDVSSDGIKRMLKKMIAFLCCND